MVLIILLQPGKGGDVGAAFGGGGGGSMFGPRGPASLLSKATTGAAVLFMVTSMTLAWYSNKATSGDIDEVDGDGSQQLFEDDEVDAAPSATPEAGPSGDGTENASDEAGSN